MLPLITTDKLWICSTNLSSIDTEALVQCLDANVSQLELYNSTVDISALSKYDGRGKCKHIMCWWSSYEKYKTEMRQWADNIGWMVKENYTLCYVSCFMYLPPYPPHHNLTVEY